MSFKSIVILCCTVNFWNNCLYTFFIPIFIEKANEHSSLSESDIGLILAVLPIALVIQSLLMQKLKKCLEGDEGTKAHKRLYLLSISLGLGVVFCMF